MTAIVWSNVSRYRTSEPESAASANHRPRSSESVAGSWCPISAASSATVWAAGRRRDDHANDTLGKAHKLFTIDSHSLPLADRRRQVSGIEGTRQQVRHRLDPTRRLHQAVRPAMLPQQLTAPAAGHEHGTLPFHGTRAMSRPPPLACRARHDAALRAQGQPVRGVLHVAAGDHSAVIGQGRGAHREARVRRVCPRIISLAAVWSAFQSISRRALAGCSLLVTSGRAPVTSGSTLAGGYLAGRQLGQHLQPIGMQPLVHREIGVMQVRHVATPGAAPRAGRAHRAAAAASRKSPRHRGTARFPSPPTTPASPS